MDTIVIELNDGNTMEIDFVTQSDGSIYYPEDGMYFINIESFKDYIENC
jgi:hypothetical protein